MTTTETAPVPGQRASALPLLCLPFAGAGAAFYTPWCERAPRGLRVEPVALPGREARLAEDPYTDLVAAADGTADEIAERHPRGSEVALFGHCLGALLAHEVAWRLHERGRSVRRLIVSGSPTRPSGPAASEIVDDDAFLAEVARFAAYEHEALVDPELRELLLPVLRADVWMFEHHRPPVRGPIPVPITALRGRSDSLVSRLSMARWQRETSADFAMVELAGDHMYPVSATDRLLDVIARQVA